MDTNANHDEKMQPIEANQPETAAPGSPPAETATPPPEAEPAKEPAAEPKKGPDWKAWRHKAGAFLRDPDGTSLAPVRFVERLIEWARGAFSVQQFDGLTGWAMRYGHLALIVAEVTCVVLGLVAAIRFDNWRLLPVGLGFGLLLVILQYTAYRFLEAGDRLIQTSPSRLRSRAFTDCLALITEVFGLMVFLSYAFRGDLSLFVVGLAVWALCDGIAFVALHPEMINVAMVDDVHAGEEAIGILSFGVKALLRIVPVAFGVGAFLGSLALVIGTVKLMAGNNLLAGTLSALWLIIGCLVLPFFSYIVFAFYHLTIDLLSAILVLPAKLDRA